MTDPQPANEFRLKRGNTILNYISQFSSTEKAIFSILVIVAIVTAIVMASKVNAMFLVEVPASGGELREGLLGLPRTINPVLAVSDVDRDIASLVYAGLTRAVGQTMSPDLAQSWSVSDDGLTYTFTLRNDLRFQDGTALTAEDVAFTVQKIQDPALKSPHAADWANVTVREVSPTVIEFILKQPYSPFITNTAIGIMPKHIWGGVSDDQFIFSTYNVQPVGAGPYKIASIARDNGGIPTEYRLAAWNGFYGAKPHVSSITFAFFADAEKAFAALDSGRIDSLPSVSPAQAARLASDSAQSYTILSAPLPRIFGVFFNQNQSAVLADKSVRKALDMAVDRDIIIKTVLSGYGTPIQSPLPAGLASSSPAIATTTGDIAGAEALLEKNGWKKNSSTGVYEYQKKGSKTVTPLSFDIYTADTPDLKQAAELVRNAWSTLGAQVNVKIFEPSDLYQNVIRPRKYDALLFGELIGKDRDLYAFWHSSQRNAPGLNVSMYANSKTDKLLEDIRTTGDAATRTAKYGQFDQLLRSDIPAVFLYSPDFIYAVPKALSGIRLGSITVPSDRLDSLGSWYIETENVWKLFAK